MEAVKEGDVERIQSIVAGGADVDAAVDEHGSVSLHHAASLGNREILMLLLDGSGAQADIQNHDGDTPLHLAVANGRVSCVEILARRGGTSLG